MGWVDELARQYRDMLLATEGLTLQPVSAAVAEEAARLRAVRELRTPDAIQLATARVTGAHTFVTNDARLVAGPDLPVLVLDHLRQSE